MGQDIILQGTGCRMEGVEILVQDMIKYCFEC